MRILLPIACCLALFLSVAQPVHGTSWTVTAGADDRFHPENLTIVSGDVVTWVNEDADAHTATSGAPCTPDGSWDSGSIAPGGTFTRTFDNSGTFQYICVFHCDMGMVGTIVVLEPTATESGTWGTIKSLYR